MEDILEYRRIAGIMVAIIAAALIIIGGKSCVDDAIQNKRKSLRATTSPYVPTSPTPPPNMNTAPTEETSAEETSDEREYVTVTDIFGEVVERIPVTTPEEANMPTTTLSILDAYNAASPTMPTEEITTAPISIPDEDDIIIHIN